MESQGGSNKQKSCSKGKAKEKKKQVKVVYISNPMRVEASASEFKDLVQELTGQDSDVSDLSKFGNCPSRDGPGRPMQQHRPPQPYDGAFSPHQIGDLYEPPSSSFNER